MNRIKGAARWVAKALGLLVLWAAITFALLWTTTGHPARLLVFWPVSLLAVWWWYRGGVETERKLRLSEREGYRAALDMKDEHIKWQRGQLDWWTARSRKDAAEARDERHKVRKIVDMLHTNYLDEVRTSWNPDIGRSGRDFGRYVWERAQRIELGVPTDAELNAEDERLEKLIPLARALDAGAEPAGVEGRNEPPGG